MKRLLHWAKANPDAVVVLVLALLAMAFVVVGMFRWSLGG